MGEASKGQGSKTKRPVEKEREKKVESERADES